MKSKKSAAIFRLSSIIFWLPFPYSATSPDKKIGS